MRRNNLKYIAAAVMLSLLLAACGRTAGTESNAGQSTVTPSIAQVTDVTQTESSGDPSATDPPGTEPVGQQSTSAVTAPPSAPRTSPPTVTEQTAAPPKAEQPVSQTLTPITPDEQYGRQYLAGQRKGLLEAYNRIALCVENCQQRAELADLKLTEAELETVYYCYWTDYPQHFWVSTGYLYAFNPVNKIVADYSPIYTILADPETVNWRDDIPDVNAINAAREEVRTAAASLLDGLHDGMPQEELEKTIHDRLVRLVQYDMSQNLPHTHSLYAALVGHEAVCDGYARAYQYLLNQAGLPSITVIGKARSDGDWGPHAWNLVLVDGTWRNVDVTWDDPVGVDDPKFIQYTYYNISAAEMAKSHKPDEMGFPLPDCA